MLSSAAATQSRRRGPLRPFSGKRIRPTAVKTNQNALASAYEDDAEIVAKLITTARAALRPWATMVKPHPDHINSLGDYEGIGLHLKLAGLPLEPNGSVSLETLQRFHADGEIFLDGLQAAALNYTVLFSLFLTISISLLVMHAGSSAYAASAASDTTLAFHSLDTNDTLLGVPVRDAWGDLAAFAWPEALETQRSMRRSFYAAECAFLGLSAFMFVCGVYEGCLLFVVFGTGLPNVADKYLWVLENPWRLTHMWVFMFMGPVFMLIGIAFLTARSSAIAFLTAAAVAVLYFLFCCCYHADFDAARRHQKAPGKISIGVSIMVAQKRAAQRILKQCDDESSRQQATRGCRGGEHEGKNVNRPVVVTEATHVQPL